MKARVGAMQFSVDGLTSDLSSFQDSQQAATGEILSLLRGGQKAKDNEVKQVSLEESGPQARLSMLHRKRREGKLSCSDEEFAVLANLAGKTSSKVGSSPPTPPVVPMGLGFSSQGFASYFEDYPTTSDDSGTFSSVRMDALRAKAANKATMTKAFASEKAFHEFCVSRGFLHRDNENFAFFSTLIFQTRELVLRDSTWETSKAYLTRLWTVQANEGRPWIELVGCTSAKRYVDAILPEFRTFIDSTKFSLLQERVDKVTKKNKSPKDKKKHLPGEEKKSKENDFYCEWHNAWFPKAAHEGKCAKKGKQRPGDRNGP
jgi:hypothetical protein